MKIPRVTSEIHALLEGRRTVVDEAFGPVHSKIIFCSSS
jgi:hypothetical protein